MNIIMETSRLLLREMTQSDYPSLSSIMQDERTMKAYEGAFSDEETQEWLDKMLARYETEGLGLWAVILKETNEMIGQVGLTWQNVGDQKVLEIGYLFNRDHWDKGYAAESAVACKEYAFTTLNASEVYSIIRDTNIASMNVAIRNGMLIRNRFIKHYRNVDMPHFLFSVKNT